MEAKDCIMFSQAEQVLLHFRPDPGRSRIYPTPADSKSAELGQAEMDAGEGTIMMTARAAPLQSALMLSSLTRRAYVSKSPRTSRENASALPPTGSWPDCRKPSRTADSAIALLMSALRRAPMPRCG